MTNLTNLQDEHLQNELGDLYKHLEKCEEELKTTKEDIENIRDNILDCQQEILSLKVRIKENRI